MALQDQLRDLYLLEKQVRGMRARLNAAISRTNALQAKRQQLQRQRDEIAEQLKQAQARVSTAEKEISEMDSRIEKARTQMNSVKSHKEYQALVVEVNTLKVDKGKVEEKALERMQEVDNLKAKLGEMEQQLADRAKLESNSLAEVQAARDEVGAKLDEVTAQRDAAAAALPRDAVVTFNRLADMHEGEAMAEIEEQDRRRKEYTCGGCYMSLPVERINAVMGRPDTIVTCPACGRILYVNEELKAAIGAKS